MEKSQRLAAAVICVIILTIMRVFFTILFFISSVICIIHAESRVERCDGHLTLSQKAVDSLNTTSTFVETAVSSFLIFFSFDGSRLTSGTFSRLFQDKDTFGCGLLCGLREFSQTF